MRQDFFYVVVLRALLTMMMTTAVSIMAMPMRRREVRGSLKTRVPMATAVTGSSEPMMAVGVEPMRRTAMAMVTSEMSVGTMPSMSEKPSCVGVVRGWSEPQPGFMSELRATVAAPMTMT